MLDQVSQAWHNLLKADSSKFIWKAARAEECHVPAPPTGLTEVEWARLMFTKKCQVRSTSPIGDMALSYTL